MESDIMNQEKATWSFKGIWKAVCVMWSDGHTAKTPDKLDAPVDYL